MTHSFPTRRSSDRYKTCPCFPQVSAPIWSLARKSCGISSLRRCYTTVKQPIWKSCVFFGLCCTLATLELPNCLTLSSEHGPLRNRSEEHTSELQSLMRISYAVFCLKKKTTT